MKQIIERQLPLNTTYTLTDKKYIPLEESFGICCDNCGTLIANIATVSNEDGKEYEIGFDCLETILINNQLLSSGDIEEYENVKKMIPKILRTSKKIKETLTNHNQSNAHKITGILFEQRIGDYFPFHWEINNVKSRSNDFFKLTHMDEDFFKKTLRNIFPKLNIH